LKEPNFFWQGSYDKAIESLNKVIEKFPSDVEGYYNLGLAYLRKEEIDQAIASLEKATELSPDITQVHLALDECYFNKEETEKALEILKERLNILRAF
jgi:tetratricopeptide (TPR) repeat protein